MDYLQPAVAEARKLLVEFAGAAPRLVAAALVLLVAWLFARLVRGAVRRAAARLSTTGHVDVVVGSVAYGAVWVVGSILALAELRVSLTALIAALGLTGLGLGFAFKDILSNLLAGVIILFQRPFLIGDHVRIDTYEGVVENIRVRDTVLRCADGTVAYLPNEKVYLAAITNISAPDVRRAEVELSIELGSDLPKAVSTAEQALAGEKAVLADPPPEVLVEALADGAVRLACRFWIEVAATPFAAARSQVAATLKLAMDDAKVTLK